MTDYLIEYSDPIPVVEKRKGNSHKGTDVFETSAIVKDNVSKEEIEGLRFSIYYTDEADRAAQAKAKLRVILGEQEISKTPPTLSSNEVITDAELTAEEVG